MSGSTEQFRKIFLEGIPLIDVRSPREFAEGHFPNSINLPLMTNDERHLVGIEYKKFGQEKAIELGHKLVSGTVKNERVQAWKEFINANPKAKLYCFRGGLRSQISCQWLKDSGVTIEKIPGGYKALRQFLLEVNQNLDQYQFITIAGQTGSKKTVFLESLKLEFNILNLEKEANHRGSSFGNLGEQPAQITFENRIAIEILKMNKQGPIIVEDESRRIGNVQTPSPLYEKIHSGKYIYLVSPFEERIQHIAQEYVFDEEKKFGNAQIVYEKLKSSLDRIKNKLGGLRYEEVLKELKLAFESNGHHSHWIKLLLKYYYDPMYDYRTLKLQNKILFQGNQSEVYQFLKRGNYE